MSLRDHPAVSTDAKLALGRRLRRLRESSGLSRLQVGQSIGADGSKIWRLENGAVGTKPRDLQALLDLYGIDSAQERGYLSSMLGKEHRPGWWNEFELPLWLDAYLALEDDAAHIRSYDPQLIPPILQTGEYAQAVLRQAKLPVREPVDAAIGADVALKRQERCRREDGPYLWFVLDEAALLRPIGGPHVQLAQLDALIDAAKEPRITLQIVRMAGSEYGGFVPHTGAFTILRFAERDRPDLVYLHQLVEDVAVDDDRRISAYLETHIRLSVAADPPEAAFDLITEIRRRVGRAC